MGKRAFEGINVLDFTWVGVGPLTTKYLADHGATVVRVESKRRPDTLRLAPPFKNSEPGIDRSGYYAFLNANKYSLALDLNHPRAIEIVRKLVIWADIVAESFAPGVMEKWGLTYEQLKKIKPDIIMYRTSNQGQTGPHSHLPGYGSQLVGLSGFTSITGWPDRDPVQPYGAYTDVCSFPFGAAALIGALLFRFRTGKGQCLDLSQYEASLHFLAPLLLDYTVNGVIAGRTGNSHPAAAPHGVYRCRGKERWCAIAVFTDEEWSGLCRTMGEPDWTRDPRFGTFMSRKENETELNRLVETWTQDHASDDVMRLLQEAEVPAAVVNHPGEVRRDAQLNQRGQFWVLNHSEIGPYLHIAQPFTLSATPAEGKMPSPCLGEHTEHVCREFLGIPDQEFVDLLNAGVFE